MAKDILVPDIGDNSNVEVIEVLVKVGDAIDKEDSLITLETDKATMDIPAPSAGVVKELKLSVGDKVSKGSLILVLEEAGSAAVAAPDAAPAKAESPAPVAASAAASVQEVRIPDIGDNKGVEVIEVLVKAGDSIAKEDGLITLETDKATMDIPSPVTGVVKQVQIKVGDKASQGDLILLVEVAGQGVAAQPAAAPTPAVAPVKAEAAAAPAPASTPAPVAASPVATEHQGDGHATPSVRRYAREHGADLGRVRGSGRKQRILKEDVTAYIKQQLTQVQSASPQAAAAGSSLPFNLPAWPKVDFAKFGEVEVQPLSRIQKISGPALHRNWVAIPHVTQWDEADITELEAFRGGQKAVAEKAGVKLTPLTFMLKAVAYSLRAFPAFNASLSDDGQSLVLKKYVHIGVAVDTPNGLVVPVVRDVDQKSLFQLARELGELSLKARDGKLTAADMQGGCFTISSLGGIGGTAFTPIINAPEVAILGVSKSELKPKWSGTSFEPRLMLPLSLSYDHRVIDGAQACRFITHLSGVLGDIRKLLL